MKLTAEGLQHDLAAIIDPAVADVLVHSYLEMQQRYYAGDWMPAELDGGKFCEAVARALYQVDTGVATTKGVGEICSQLKKNVPPPNHTLQEKDREHFCRVLEAVYKLRNDRGIAHISVTAGHDANLMDATLIVGVVKWLFCEFMRLAQNLDRQEVLAAIETITQFVHPLVHELEGEPQVMLAGLPISDEILMLLQHCPQRQATKAQLVSWIPNATLRSVNMAVQSLRELRRVRQTGNGEIAITPLGQTRVSEASRQRRDNAARSAVSGKRTSKPVRQKRPSTKMRAVSVRSRTH